MGHYCTWRGGKKQGGIRSQRGRKAGILDVRIDRKIKYRFIGNLGKKRPLGWSVRYFRVTVAEVGESRV